MTNTLIPIRKAPRTLILSSYPPQQCGIATFTRDLASAMVQSAGRSSVGIGAVAADPSAFNYPQEVRLTIGRNDRSSFRAAAEYLNDSQYDVICVQHEFGLFGGDEGGYLLDLLHHLRKPVLTTLHTVHADPPEHYRRRLLDVVAASDAVVVLTPTAIRLLEDVYGASSARIEYIAHGIPDIPFVEPNDYKPRLSADGRIVLMTFGLLGPSKGIEDMIDALPDIVARHPDVVYMIVGATHPGVLAHAGESYRESLMRKIEEKGMADNVVFHNRYLNNEELYDYLRACDIYVTPYPNREQISSGTIAYAAGMGKAVVSTDFIYAEDLLANGRGLLVERRSPQALADAVNFMIENDAERNDMRWRAYQHGRKMIWRRIAGEYQRLASELVRPLEVQTTLPSQPIVRGGIEKRLLAQYNTTGGA
jgi:glycosyltransferase involved in cell wall biosynthesis